jgi:mannose-6-phosphate isomerase-like protein (cupin superfamily)
MIRKSTLHHLKWTGISLACLIAAAAPAFAQQGAPMGNPLAQRIGRYNPATTTRSNSVHAGAGPLEYHGLFGNQALSTNLIFLHRGIILPGGGIGQHFHNHCEEMFMILEDADAEFTVNGRTAVLHGPTGAPNVAGASHAIYNPSNRPLQWLNINVGESKTYDNYDLNDNRVGAPKDAIPQFMNFRIDSALLRPAPAGLNPTGTVTFRRLLGPAVFRSVWSYFDHIAIGAGGRIAPAVDANMSTAYYVYKGAGSVTVNGETVAIKAGDAVPVDLGQSNSFTQTGTEPLELLAIGIAKDAAAKTAYATSPGQGGRGAGGGNNNDRGAAPALPGQGGAPAAGRGGRGN